MSESEHNIPVDDEVAIPQPPMSVRIEDIAEACHEVNRVIQRVQGGARTGIPVAPPWVLLSQEMRASVVEGVVGILSGKTPEQSHEAWCEFKREHGWTYGPERDDTLKTHPCLLPYDQLPADQQLKDHAFKAVVLGLAQAFGSVQ